MTKRIALTGATGFVGSHLLDELVSRGYHVNALARRPQQPRENVNWILGDLDNQNALNELILETDCLINVAGLIKAKSRSDFLHANTESVNKLVHTVNNSGKSYHFIQISTLAAREATISDYAQSKNFAEQALKKETGKNVTWTIIRPPAVYGPGDTETLKIFKSLKWRIALIPAEQQARVSWIHVTDLARAISTAINNEDCFSQTYEIDDGSEQGYSHTEFYNVVSDLLSVNPAKITIPKIILKIIGHSNDIIGRIFGYIPMLSSQKVNEICHTDWVVNKSFKLKDKGWTAQYDLRKGLKQTLDWYKNNKYI